MASWQERDCAVRFVVVSQEIMDICVDVLAWMGLRSWIKVIAMNTCSTITLSFDPAVNQAQNTVSSQQVLR